MRILAGLRDLAWRLLLAPSSGGQGMAEYALVLALIVIVVILALIFLGGQVRTVVSDAGSTI